MTDWRDTARAAAEARQQQLRGTEDQANRGIANQARSLLVALIGDNEHITTQGGTILLDGVRFTAHCQPDHNRWDLIMVADCPDCGCELGSAPIWTLADLGDKLMLSNAGAFHDCPAFDGDESASTPATRLLAALHGWLESELEGQR